MLSWKSVSIKMKCDKVQWNQTEQINRDGPEACDRKRQNMVTDQNIRSVWSDEEVVTWHSIV